MLQVYTKSFENDLAAHFAGLEKASRRRQGQVQGSVKEGKDEMPFWLYRWMAKHFLVNEGKGGSAPIFSHLFSVLCWNLMCRAGNAVGICFSHMEWREDALAIYFAHMKNDQRGQKAKHPRHVYANPLMPEICPILALGMYLICHPGVLHGEKHELFPGGKQYNRFREILAKTMQHQRVKDGGIDGRNIGTHSFRKGAATYVTSGVVDGPSAWAVNQRAGWSEVGPQPRYIKYDFQSSLSFLKQVSFSLSLFINGSEINCRYEAAGDQHVGRTVNGLPPDRPEFAHLPPFFCSYDGDIRNAIGSCFPNHPMSLGRVLEFCLASLVYHSKWCRENMPASHPLFKTTLYTQSELIPQLRTKVDCKVWDYSCPVRPTGITNHTQLQLQMESMKTLLLAMPQQIESVSTSVVNGIRSALDERELEAGQLTPQSIKLAFTQAISEMGLPSTIEELRHLAIPAPPSAPVPQAPAPSQRDESEPVSETVSRQVYMWGGGLHLFPQGYEIPRGVPVLVAWQHYLCGDPANGIPPLRMLTCSELGSKVNQSKRLSDFRNVMSLLENRAKELRIWPQTVFHISVTQANEIYEQVRDVLPDEEFTAKQRKRRQGQVSWRTMSNRIYQSQQPRAKRQRRSLDSTSPSLNPEQSQNQEVNREQSQQQHQAG